MNAFNIQLFLWLSHNAGQHPMVDRMAIFFAEAGPTLLMTGLILGWLLAEDRRRLSLLEATEAAGLGLLLNQLIGQFYFHPRPFMLGLVEPLISHVPENSFPSDHATLMLTVALYLLCRHGWRWPGAILLLLALMTVWGRVYTGLHFPYDMAGSLAVALLSLGLVRALCRHLNPVNLWLENLYHLIVCRLTKRCAPPTAG